MWCAYVTEYYSATEKDGILSAATNWMRLEDTVLSEISRTQKSRISHVFL